MRLRALEKQDAPLKLLVWRRMTLDNDMLREVTRGNLAPEPRRDCGDVSVFATAKRLVSRAGVSVVDPTVQEPPRC